MLDQTFYLIKKSFKLNWLKLWFYKNLKVMSFRHILNQIWNKDVLFQSSEWVEKRAPILLPVINGNPIDTDVVYHKWNYAQFRKQLSRVIPLNARHYVIYFRIYKRLIINSLWLLVEKIENESNFMRWCIVQCLSWYF